VVYRRFACKRCWYRLPEDIRIAISDAWRTHPQAHRAAMRQAHQWYRENRSAL
jgi:hypothetical protein